MSQHRKASRQPGDLLALLVVLAVLVLALAGLVAIGATGSTPRDGSSYLECVRQRALEPSWRPELMCAVTSTP